MYVYECLNIGKNTFAIVKDELVKAFDCIYIITFDSTTFRSEFDKFQNDFEYQSILVFRVMSWQFAKRDTFLKLFLVLQPKNHHLYSCASIDRSTLAKKDCAGTGI